MSDRGKEGLETVFQGSKFAVKACDAETKSGKWARREFIDHPGAVTILPMIGRLQIVMIKNYRFAVGKSLLELPAGTRESGEEPLDTAARELIEETGYQAQSIEELCRFYTTPGICNEEMISYVASGLSWVGQNLNDGEEIEVEILSIDQIVRMIGNGEIRDGKTLSTLLYYLQFLYTP